MWVCSNPWMVEFPMLRSVCRCCSNIYLQFTMVCEFEKKIMNLRINLIDTLIACIYFVWDVWVSCALLCRYSSSTKSLHNRFMHLTNYSVNRNNSQYQPNCNDTVRQGHKWCVLFDSGFIALGHIGQRWSVHCPSSVVSLVVISQKLSKIEPLEVGTADSVIAFRPSTVAPPPWGRTTPYLLSRLLTDTMWRMYEQPGSHVQQQLAVE